MTDKRKPFFHLAFPVTDLQETLIFYRDVLGCETGRSSDQWIDFDFWGHQVVAHLSPDEAGKSSVNEVDGHAVPAKHFGLILEWVQWEELAERLQNKGVNFIIDPYIRFEGQPGEQATMFFKDPSGNALEFKAFRNEDQIFAS
ncbi:VOC family protein [Aliifodinibius salicampi]|uniref:VOC family protein n=1 Tax=Fodinibius salicampi TaxID=1920655 RepID=A0ABT3Q301_9BACT|nr:VOC family protein [Fodinibius salicampi]MCW9714495.1 VOC family protein [Fodinibius salicampi]